MPSNKAAVDLSTPDTDLCRRASARKLRALATFAEASGEQEHAAKLLALVRELHGEREPSALMRLAKRMLIGANGESVRPGLALLLLIALLIFPAIYYAVHLDHAGRLATVTLDASALSSPCLEGEGRGLMAAYYVSLRTSLFAIPDSDGRVAAAAQCLIGKSNEGMFATSWLGLCLIVQGLLSAICLFAVGFATRRRLARR